MESNSSDEYAVVAFPFFATILALMWFRRRRLSLSWENYYNRDAQRANYISRIINSLYQCRE